MLQIKLIFGENVSVCWELIALALVHLGKGNILICGTLTYNPDQKNVGHENYRKQISAICYDVYLMNIVQI